MTAQHLRDLARPRRVAVLAATVLRLEESLTDAALDLFDKLLGRALRKAERGAKEEAFEVMKRIEPPVRMIAGLTRAIIDARANDEDVAAMLDARTDWPGVAAACAAIDAALTPDTIDIRAELVRRHRASRLFAPMILAHFRFDGAPAASRLMRALDLMRDLATGARKTFPASPPIAFVRKSWRKLVMPEPGKIDRRAFELCALFELRDRLRAGDVWVEGSGERRRFDDRMIPKATFATLREEGRLPSGAFESAEAYLADRRDVLKRELAEVERLAAAGLLEEARFTRGAPEIKPIRAVAPEEAKALSRAAHALLPPIKIPDLLREVDGWTDFTSAFTHFRSGKRASNPTALFAAILADGVNLGVSRMAEGEYQKCGGAGWARVG